MVKLITVHGTFASRDSDSGDSWWQRGSPFMKDVQALIGERLDVQPFHWSGQNSEMDRRRTGANLADTINDCKEPPIVVGHSHGGSAGIQALLVMFIKKGQASAEKLRGFMTVGTPMFRFRSNLNPFARFDVVGRILLLVAIGMLAMKAGDIASQVRGGDSDITGFFGGVVEFVSSIQFGLAALTLVWLWGYSRRNTKRARYFKDNRLIETFRERYVALNHQQDEAINGLQKANTIQPKLVKRSTIFVSIFSGLSFVLLSFFFVVQLLEVRDVPLPDVVGNSFNTLENVVIDPAEDVIYAVGGDVGESQIFNDLVEVLALIPVGAFLFVSAFVALITAIIVTPGLSAFLTAQVKGQSFGDDGYGETISHVAPGLDFEQENVGTLPSTVQAQMIEASTRDASAAIQRLRELLSSGELLDTEGADLVAQSMKFERSELLHNAYFHSPLFTKYFAAQLVGRFGLKPSKAFEADPEAQAFLKLVRRQSGAQPAA